MADGKSVKEIWDAMDTKTKEAVYLISGGATREEKMVVAMVMRTPELLEVITDDR